MLSWRLWLQSLRGDILELLVDEGLVSRYHWCHWLNNVPVAGKRKTLTLRVTVVWLTRRAVDGDPRLP